jgi:hypothetical protein
MIASTVTTVLKYPVEIPKEDASECIDNSPYQNSPMPAVLVSWILLCVLRLGILYAWADPNFKWIIVPEIVLYQKASPV